MSSELLPPPAIITLMAPPTETSTAPDPMHPLRGTVEIESSAVRYVDVRAGRPELATGEIDRFVHDLEQLSNADKRGLRGLVIATSQSSDALAISLASRGIMLIVGNASDSLAMLLDRFKTQLNVIRAAGAQGAREPVLGSGIATSAPSGSAGEVIRPGTESPYAQRPPWFDQTVFDQRLRQLQQPWREEEAWKSET